MAFPIQSNVELPLLKVLSDAGGELPMLKAVELVTVYFKDITQEELTQRTDTGINKWRNWVRWARQKLIVKGELDGSTRGIWKITLQGKKRLTADWKSWNPRYSTPILETTRPTHQKAIETNPDEKIELARKEIVESISKEILDLLLKLEPNLFESLIGMLLGNMHYGSIKITGRSGDGGIDGECSIDQLGLYKIHFQAKRWQNTVPAKEIRDFIGAIQTQRGDYGIFITTSNFTKDALETAKKSGKVKTIDGPQLVELMIKNNLGVNNTSLSVPKIDYDFFEGFRT